MGDKGPSIFARLFRSKAPPQNALSTTPLVFTGRTTTGATVNQYTALNTAAVYACVRVIAEAVASLPLRVHRYQGDGLVTAPEHPLYHLLHTAPNPEMTSFVFRETMMSHLLLWGNGYAQIIRDGLGRVKALYPLLPNKMDVNRAESGEIYYTYWRDCDETRPKEKSGGVTLRKDDVLHIPGLSYDGLVGYSPIDLAKNAIAMAKAAEEYGGGFFANGAAPSGVVELEGPVADPVKIKQSWESTYAGFKNAGKVVVLEQGGKFHPITIPPEQAQFLETRKFQLNEIARVFKVPPHLIGDLEKSTFSNIEQQSLEFLMFTVEPWVVRFEQSMVLSLLSPAEQRTHVIKFNLDALMRGDFSARMNGYAIARQNGWLSTNDIRRLENLNPIPAEEGGDRYLVNGNMFDLKSTGK